MTDHMPATADRGMVSSDASPNPRPGFLSRYGSVLLLLLVVTVEAGVLRIVIRDFRAASGEVERMYAVSVIGLRRIGSLQYDAQEARRSTLYALTTNDSNLQVEYADQSRAADRRVSEGIAEYLQHAQVPSEVELGRRLQRDWMAYLRIRDEVLASILEGSTKEAVALDLTGGVPSFDQVRQDLEEVKRLYDEQASQRLANVAAGAHRSVVRLIGVLVSTLLLAGVLMWVIQRSRMASALQLARMQMEFVTLVSHELRTPLAVLCSAADNVADGVVEGKDQLKRYGAVIRNQSRKMTELVNQILMFASTKDGRGRYFMRRLQVTDVIESVVAGTAELLHQAGFVLEREIDPELPEIVGDFSALSHCLRNLVVNAVKYGEQGRWVGIRAAVDGAKDRRKKEVRISVQDRGRGIDRSEITHIFEPFYRSPSVIAAQLHGTGLGLPLAKSIAEAMGGSLTVTSELGVGSVFTLHLPIARDENPSGRLQPAMEDPVSQK